MADNKKILIVEDDSDTRQLYQEVLEDAQFAVALAADGEEGLRKIKEGGYQLILLDIMMPKIDGLVVLSQLRSFSPKPSNGPIVVITNMSNDPILNKAIELGALTYIIKSDINPDQLIEKVKSFVN